MYPVLTLGHCWSFQSLNQSSLDAFTKITSWNIHKKENKKITAEVLIQFLDQLDPCSLQQWGPLKRSADARLKRRRRNAVWRRRKMDLRVQSVIICFVPVVQAVQVRAHATLFFRHLTAFAKMCQQRCVAENHWTVPSHDNTHHEEYSKHTGTAWGGMSGRELWKKKG